MPISSVRHRLGSPRSSAASRMPIAVLFGAVVVTAWPAAAQTGAEGAAVASLQQTVEALTRRIDELEKKLEGPLTVQAPFVVTNGKTPILEISSSGGGAQLSLRGNGTLATLQAEPTTARVIVRDSAGGFASLTAGAKSTGFHATRGGDEVVIASDGTGVSYQASKSGKIEVHLGTALGDGSRLIIRGASGQEMFSVGERDGGSELRVRSGAGGAATLRAASDGADIFAQAGNEVATISADGKESVVTLAHGGNLAELTADDGARIRLSPGGKTVAEMGSPSAEGHNLMIADGAGQPMFTVGIPGGNAEVALRQGEGVAKLQARSSGNAIVSVGTGEQPSAMLATDGTSSRLMAYQSEDSASLTYDANGPNLSLIAGGNLVAELGYGDGKKTGLRLYDSGEQLSVAAELDRIALLRGDDPVASLERTNAGEGQATLFKSGGTESIRLGPRDGWRGLHVLDDGKLTLFGGDAAQGDFGFYVYGDGGATASMWLDSGGPVVDLSGAGNKRELRLGKYEGRSSALRIFNEAGTVAVAAGIGNGIPTVYVADKGVPAALMSAHPGGFGSVSVFAGGDQPVASINSADASGEGLVVVRNRSGAAVAHLGLSSSGEGGNVTAADASGNGVFSAGAASDGGGEACVYRGDKGLWCLGVGLPLSTQQ